LRKNRSKPPRQRDWTRQLQKGDLSEDTGAAQERVRAKGDLSRRRTIIAEEPDAAAGQEPAELRAVDVSTCLPGRVVRVHKVSDVETEDGRRYRCTPRGRRKPLATDERSVVATGDRVWFRPEPNGEGLIERVEPRHGLLTRASKNREQVLVANVDQAVIVVSLVEPNLKPHL